LASLRLARAVATTQQEPGAGARSPPVSIRRRQAGGSPKSQANAAALAPVPPDRRCSKAKQTLGMKSKPVPRCPHDRHGLRHAATSKTGIPHRETWLVPGPPRTSPSDQHDLEGRCVAGYSSNSPAARCRPRDGLDQVSARLGHGRSTNRANSILSIENTAAHAQPICKTRGEHQRQSTSTKTPPLLDHFIFNHQERDRRHCLFPGPPISRPRLSGVVRPEANINSKRLKAKERE